LQELFGLNVHPAIAKGKIPLVLELLSPAHRPVQVTRDLPGFWRGSMPPCDPICGALSAPSVAGRSGLRAADPPGQAARHVRINPSLTLISEKAIFADAGMVNLRPAVRRFA
jgi:hypothetical protein